MRQLGLRRFSNHLTGLSFGDRLIVGVLSVSLFILVGYGIYVLERAFLVEVPVEGGTLVEGVVGSPRFVNPLLALSDADQDLVTLTYGGLMGYDEHGHLVPVLAETYEISEDGTMYTFILREDAKFSDGTPVTAEDVIFTVGKAQDPDLKSPRLSDFANITVEAIDARTIRFTLPRAYAPFLEEATLGILPAQIWEGVDNAEFPFAKEMERPVGAGPFTVTNVTRNKEGAVERYELSAFRDYPLGRPYLDRITLIYVPDEEALTRALLRGQVESAYGVPGDYFLRAPYSRIFGAFINQSGNEALARIAVRKALSVSVNREALTREALAGFALPAYGPVPPGLAPLPLVEESVDRVLEAKTILEDDGWTFAEGGWTNEDGDTLSFTLTTANVPELKAVAERLRSDWEAIGIPVSLQVYDANDLVRKAIRPRNYELLLFGMVVGQDKDFYAFWDSSQRQDPGLNVSLYANSQVDALLESLRTEQDPVAIEDDLIELNELIKSDYPAVFTHAPEFVYSTPEDLKGVYLGTPAAPADRFLTTAFWYRRTEYVWPVFAPKQLEASIEKSTGLGSLPVLYSLTN